MSQHLPATLRELERTLADGWSLAALSAYPSDASAQSDKPTDYELYVDLCSRSNLPDMRVQFLRIPLAPGQEKAELARLQAFVAAAQDQWAKSLASDVHVVCSDVLASLQA